MTDDEVRNWLVDPLLGQGYRSATGQVLRLRHHRKHVAEVVEYLRQLGARRVIVTARQRVRIRYRLGGRLGRVVMSNDPSDANAAVQAAIHDVGRFIVRRWGVV